MTSETGQKNPADSLRERRQGRGGFTLIELMLAAGLVLLLTGILALNYNLLERRGRMQEAVRQFEASLRLAKAEAAGKGKRFRLEFLPEGQFKFTWEPQPLTEPGVFQDYTLSSWARELPCDWLSVRDCRLTSPSLQSIPQVSATSSDAVVLSPISFYPDGSSDSAVLQVAGRLEDETRTAVIELDGLNGIITTRLLLPSELEEYQQSHVQP